jgi:hypothetical protein
MSILNDLLNVSNDVVFTTTDFKYSRDNILFLGGNAKNNEISEYVIDENTNKSISAPNDIVDSDPNGLLNNDITSRNIKNAAIGVNTSLKQIGSIIESTIHDGYGSAINVFGLTAIVNSNGDYKNYSNNINSYMGVNTKLSNVLPTDDKIKKTVPVKTINPISDASSYLASAKSIIGSI